jgi:hypothetical protein
MANEAEPADLVVLVPDRNTEFAVRGLLARPKALGIRAIRSQIYSHLERDPGCLLRGPEFLAPLRDQYAHALILLDQEGSGRDAEPRTEIEQTLERRLEVSWGPRAAAIVLEPELEVWWWSDSPHVDDILGWKGRVPTLRDWLTEKGLLSPEAIKPRRPKEAVELALRKAQKPRSSALYQQLASRVSFERCSDPAFLKLLATLRAWFAL